MTIKIISFIKVKALKRLQMKTTLLVALSIGTITKSASRESIVLLTSSSRKMDFTDLDVVLFTMG